MALRVNGSTVYNTTVLYILQGIMYSLNIYFAIAGTDLFQHKVKALQRRLDFSIDIYSPLLKMEKHIKRRIWQETLSTILLCGTSYQMPTDQVVAFSVSDDQSWPPYLLWFQGSVAERHVENFKILKTIGLREYERAVDYSRSHVADRLSTVVRTIQTKFAGPDAYWRPLQPPYPDGVSSWFGRAFLVPFPPTLVIRYDQGGSTTVQLTSLLELESFVEQNERASVDSKRTVRRAIRALEGQTVLCPYNDLEYTMSDSRFPTFGQSSRYISKPIAYAYGVLKIKRRRDNFYAGYNYNSGFDVTIVYEEGRRQDPQGISRVRKKLEVGASRAFGLQDDCELTAQLAQFMRDNERLIRHRLGAIGDLLTNYRDRFYLEALEKTRVLSYAFLTDVFNRPELSPAELIVALRQSGSCKKVARLSSDYQAAITVLYERLQHVRRSPVHQWWWLFWDELWRKNSRDYAVMRKHRRALSPSFPSSIAYRPIPRAELEAFLKSRGLWQKDGAQGLFNRGLLNRVYFQLDQLVFASGSTSSTKGAPIAIGLGDSVKSVEPVPYNTLRVRDLDQAKREALKGHRYACVGGEELDHRLIRPEVLDDIHAASRLTGGGTDYEQSNIFIRPAFTWEQRMTFLKPSLSRWSRVKNRIFEWLSLQPFIIDTSRDTLFLYLIEDGDRYLAPPRARAPSRCKAVPSRTNSDMTLTSVSGLPSPSHGSPFSSSKGAAGETSDSIPLLKLATNPFR